ncbi:MAG: DNA methyltransferase [Planctomycetota bacterium]|nr:DNA methyltransferase [Planctomycetota bacterium]
MSSPGPGFSERGKPPKRDAKRPALRPSRETPDPFSGGVSARNAARSQPNSKPPLTPQTTTLWEYPSQHYDAWIDDDGNLIKSKSRRREESADPAADQSAGSDESQASRAKPDIARAGPAMQGNKAYVGATPSWVIWQLLVRYTRPGDLVVDPMCGSGTTLDVARDLERRALGYDIAPSRPDIFRADARKLPLEAEKADFVFVDPPYGTNVEYSNDPACIGTLDVHRPGTEPGARQPRAQHGAYSESGQGAGYYASMTRAIAEMHRILKPRRFMALYVCDSYQKKRDRDDPSAPPTGASIDRVQTERVQAGRAFAPIGFELFQILSQFFTPMDIICVVRHNAKLKRGNWKRAAIEGSFYLRGFNYLFIMKKTNATGPAASRQ